MIVKGGPIFGKEIANILIIQLGDIGDVVWSTPTFRAVKDAYPRAGVSLLLREGFGSILNTDPSIHKIFEVSHYAGSLLHRGKKQLTFIKALRDERFDLVFDLRAGDRGAITAFLTGAPIRASMIFHRDVPFWRNLFFTHLADPPSSRERIYGAAEQSLRIVREFGIDSANTKPKLWVSDEVMERVHNILEHGGLATANRWISVNPFSRWQYKEWAYEKWVKILEWLWEKKEIATVIVGASDEFDKASYIAGQCDGRTINLVGKTTLSELAGVLSLSTLNIGVDSAAPHIAAAVGTPTITIYGPSDWREWAPQGDMHDVVSPNCDCAPCYGKGCDNTGESRCLDALEVGDVIRAIEKFLNGEAKQRSGK